MDTTFETYLLWNGDDIGDLGAGEWTGKWRLSGWGVKMPLGSGDDNGDLTAVEWRRR